MYTIQRYIQWCHDMILEHIKNTTQISNNLEQILNSNEAVFIGYPTTHIVYQETVQAVETYLTDTNQFIMLYRNLYDDDPILYTIELVAKRIHRDVHLFRFVILPWLDTKYQEKDLIQFQTYQTIIEDTVLNLYLSFSQMSTLLDMLRGDEPKMLFS